MRAGRFAGSQSSYAALLGRYFYGPRFRGLIWLLVIYSSRQKNAHGFLRKIRNCPGSGPGENCREWWGRRIRSQRDDSQERFGSPRACPGSPIMANILNSHIIFSRARPNTSQKQPFSAKIQHFRRHLLFHFNGLNYLGTREAYL